MSNTWLPYVPWALGPGLGPWTWTMDFGHGLGMWHLAMALPHGLGRGPSVIALRKPLATELGHCLGLRSGAMALRHSVWPRLRIMVPAHGLVPWSLSLIPLAFASGLSQAFTCGHGFWHSHVPLSLKVDDGERRTRGYPGRAMEKQLFHALFESTVIQYI